MVAMSPLQTQVLVIKSEKLLPLQTVSPVRQLPLLPLSLKARNRDTYGKNDQGFARGLFSWKPILDLLQLYG